MLAVPGRPRDFLVRFEEAVKSRPEGLHASTFVRRAAADTVVACFLISSPSLTFGVKLGLNYHDVVRSSSASCPDSPHA